MELMPEPNIMPRMRMTMMSLMRRLTAITTSSTSAAPSHAASAMPSDCTNECAETPSSGSEQEQHTQPGARADAQHRARQRVAEKRVCICRPAASAAPARSAVTKL